MKAKLTVRSVTVVQPGAKDVILWDDQLAGFGLKVTPAGRRTYFLYYRTKDGQQRRPAIGTHPAVKPEAAREIAKRWLADVAQGRDPSQSRSQDRVAPTMKTLCERYLAEHAEVRKKASSIVNDRRLITSHILPALGAKKVAAVGRADIVALHHKMRNAPYDANRMLALASKMLSLAEMWGLRPDGSNPAKGVRRYRENKRERYLSAVELGRLWRVLDREDSEAVASPNAVNAIKLLILTGRRLGEVLSLEWSMIDLDKKTMRLPETKNGALLVSLSDTAVELLANIKRTGLHEKYVILGHRTGRPLVNLQKPWRAIRATADLADVRIHDLRHSYASVAAGLGMSLPLIGKLLGHKEVATTARYAHLAQDPIRVAADAIGVALKQITDAPTL